MRKGSLKNQINSILEKQFPEMNESLGPIMIESVKVVVQEDCVKILPQFNRVIPIEFQSTFDHDEYDKMTQIEQRPPSPVPRTSSKSCPVVPAWKPSVTDAPKEHVVNELKKKLGDVVPSKSRLPV
jgi:hypothetical protein